MKVLQNRIGAWLLTCFDEKVAMNPIERNYRFLEEALELVQACGCEKADALKLVDYVFNRPKGEISQEVGGVMVTLAALCNVHAVIISDAAGTEIKRIERPEVIQKIRAKQVTKDIRCKI